MSLPSILIAHGVPGDSIHDRVFALLPKAPEVAYIGAANGDNENWFGRIAQVVQKRYGAHIAFARTGNAEEGREAARLVDEAQLIYLSGGDVNALAERVRALKLDERIRARKADGAMVVGVSAGAIGLTRYWIDFLDDNDESKTARFPCIGAVPIAVDCHDEDGDWEELRALLHRWGIDEPDAEVDAYGIPQGGAIEIDAGGKVSHLVSPPKHLRLDHGRIVE